MPGLTPSPIGLAINTLEDGQISLWEARGIYRANTDPKLEIWVDARQLSVEPPGKFEWDRKLNRMVAKSTVVDGWVVHGSTTVVKNDNGSLGLAKDVYDFTMNPRTWYGPGRKGEVKHTVRNSETGVAGAIHGSGTAFTFGYIGLPRIED